MSAGSTAAGPAKVDVELLKSLARTVRGLSIDAIEAANSGHPGLPLGCADFAVTLWYHFLRYNPDEPLWPGRDKFILSGGHGSMLLYSLLHLAGYDLSLDDLKKFRTFGSKTPGHPESHLTKGVEVATGPLGQGFAMGVGMALADRMLAARVNRYGFRPFDNYIYGLVTDGDLMEGVALEAASFASFNKLGNIIYLYDDNDITLDGPSSLTFNHENTQHKFEAMGWHVLRVDGFNHQQVADAIVAAQLETTRPSLIICKTVIGYGSPHKAGTSAAHGSPLGAEEAKLTKEALGIPLEPKFHVPDADRKAWAARKEQNKNAFDAWKEQIEKGRASHPDAVKMMETMLKREVPKDIESKLPAFDVAKPIATRKASEATLKAIAGSVPWLVGGSADLSGSTNAILPGDIHPGQYDGRHIFFGVREHGMGAIVNGMTQQGAFRAFGATFFTFSDYMRGAVRVGALMEAPAIWVWSHDSIFLGEDGPTHQPVEHLAAIRAIPGLVMLRPGDAVETAESWVAALRNEHGPSAIILTRQNLLVYDRKSAEFSNQIGSLAKGAYVFRREKDAGRIDGILLGTGSELQLCVEAARALEKEGKSIRVVSMPSWNLFEHQEQKYRDEILPPSVAARVGVEAGVSLGWHRWVGQKGGLVTIDRFGASAPAPVLAKEFGFTADNVVKVFKSLA